MEQNPSENFAVEKTPDQEKEEMNILLKRLNPRDQVDRLILILGMPRDVRPADTLTIFEREQEIIDWARSENGPGLPELKEKIEYLISKQRG